MTSPNLQKALKTHTNFVATSEEPFRLALHLWLRAATGKPVALEELARTLHRPLQETQTLLQTWDHHVDEKGHIVASGLSLVPTVHQFHLGELAFSTWCALDTLAFPAILGQSACVISRCPVTEQEIRLTVTPEGIKNLNPEGAVVSVRLPVEATSTCTIQQDICNDGRFFLSLDVAATWPHLHPQAVLLDVEEAAELGRMMAHQIKALEQAHEGQYSI